MDFFLHLRKSYNIFRSFSSEKKVSLIIFTGDIYFHFEGLTLNSLLDRTTTKEAKSKDDNTEPCPPVQTLFTYFFFIGGTLFSFLRFLSIALNSSFHGVLVEMYRKC